VKTSHLRRSAARLHMHRDDGAIARRLHDHGERITRVAD
jgi:hypothetical protein